MRIVDDYADRFRRDAEIVDADDGDGDDEAADEGEGPFYLYDGDATEIRLGPMESFHGIRELKEYANGDDLSVIADEDVELLERSPNHDLTWDKKARPQDRDAGKRGGVDTQPPLRAMASSRTYREEDSIPFYRVTPLGVKGSNEWLHVAPETLEDVRDRR